VPVVPLIGLWACVCVYVCVPAIPFGLWFDCVLVAFGFFLLLSLSLLLLLLLCAGMPNSFELLVFLLF